MQCIVGITLAEPSLCVAENHELFTDIRGEVGLALYASTH